MEVNEVYLLIIKDGFSKRYIGPYLTTKHASDDLPRILLTSSKKASWQIHCLEKPESSSLDEKRDFVLRQDLLPKAS